MARIFISYKRVDKEKVFKIKDQIESALGEKCWIDLDGIESDAQFANVIINAINECEVFLFMYSSAHSKIVDYKSDWTVRELDFAHYKKKRIVFINIDQSPLSDWFYMLFGTMQQIDATSQDAVQKLLSDIANWLIIQCKQNKVIIRENEEPANRAQSNIVFKIDSVVFNMVLVEKGEFIMGALDNDKTAFRYEKPRHKVILTKNYYIGEIPVSQALWSVVMGDNPAKNKGINLPVENVSWKDCKTFLKKLSLLTNREFRLPTEAEWEYAAKGGDKKCSRNYKYSGSDIVDDVAWYKENSGFNTHEPGLKKSNELGIFDMSGNVWEWCQDRWEEKYSENDQCNPLGPSNGFRRVIRGGSWFNDAWGCRLSVRSYEDPDYHNGDIGLRLVLPE